MLVMYEQYGYAGLWESQQLIQPILKRVGVVNHSSLETERERRKGRIESTYRRLVCAYCRSPRKANS
jgi:hypothetical protein